MGHDGLPMLAGHKGVWVHDGIYLHRGIGGWGMMDYTLNVLKLSGENSFMSSTMRYNFQ